MADPAENNVTQLPVRRRRKRVIEKNPTGLFEDGEAKKKAAELFGQEDNALLTVQKNFGSRGLADPFGSIYSIGTRTGSPTVIKPTYDPGQLLHLVTISSVLNQCIEAYVVNVDGHGQRLEYVGPDGEEESSESLLEKNYMEGLIQTPNEEYSMAELRRRLRRDYETFGYWAMECSRDDSDNVCAVYHTPSTNLRMTTMDEDKTVVETLRYSDGQFTKQKVAKRFRRFVQRNGTKTVYFKEFGDPRVISAVTGKVWDEENNGEIPLEEVASEILFHKQYSPNEYYGLPRWIGCLPNILGLRESEGNNLQFFKDNAIPAMMLLIAGGYLSDESTSELEGRFVEQKGRAMSNKVMVLEAYGDEQSSNEQGQINNPTISVETLTDKRQSEGQFQDYEKNSITRIRSAFRLPPLFLGMPEEMTFATAHASLVMTDSQVFGPERNTMDELFNNRVCLINGYRPRYWNIRSQPPKITDPSEVMDALQKFEELGAMTPNVAIGMANELFDLAIPLIEEEWGNLPFTLVREQITKDKLEEVAEELATGDEDDDEGDDDGKAPPKSKKPKSKEQDEDDDGKAEKKSASPVDAKAAKTIIQRQTMESGLTQKVRIRRRKKPDADTGADT